MNTNKKTEKEFHAVDFMRQVRSELSELFMHDKKKYFDYLDKAMEDFKLRQKKAQLTSALKDESHRPSTS